MENVLTGIDSLVQFTNSKGSESRGTLVHITRSQAIFEVYNPFSIVQMTEVLEGLHVLRGERLVYKGKAVVTKIVTTGIMIIVEVTLIDAWSDLTDLLPGKGLKEEVDNFVNDWDKSHTLHAPYQLIVTKIGSFLTDLSRWLVEAEAGGLRDKSSESLDEEFFLEVSSSLAPKVASLFGEFETTAKQISEKDEAMHKSFARRILHPLMLCSPFVERTYHKPLGYAGDFDMVNMMLRRSDVEIPNAYSRIIDSFYIDSPAPEAHRNRVVMLEERLSRELKKAVEDERRFTVLNIGCGPAVEVQNLIKNDELAKYAAFTLMDFNDYTLNYTKNKIADALKANDCDMQIEFITKSIDDLLRENVESSPSDNPKTYDMVYCAGLFDYFSPRICTSLVKLFHSWVKPGGHLTLTNVHDCNPSKKVMEHLLEWYLFYRTDQQMKDMIPEGAEGLVTTDVTGVNVFLDINKKL